MLYLFLLLHIYRLHLSFLLPLAMFETTSPYLSKTKSFVSIQLSILLKKVFVNEHIKNYRTTIGDSKKA